MYARGKASNIGKALIVAITGLALLTSPASATPHKQSPTCTHFVDNSASFDGDGSEAQPWDNIADHVDDLDPGDVMCIRGDTSGSGRVYNTEMIRLDSEDGATQDGTMGHPIKIRSHPGEKVLARNIGDSYLVYFRGVDYWILEGLVLDNNNKPQQAINFCYNADHNILRNNEILNGWTDGVVIGRGSRDNTIENNHIHHFSDPDLAKDAHCILIRPEADNTIVRRNTIHDCSGDGIQLIRDEPKSSYNVQIIENTIYRGALTRTENAVDIKAATNLRVADNEMFGYFDNQAIIVHHASQDVVFENNIIYDSLRGFLIDAKEGGHPEGLTLENNLIYNITDYAIVVDGVKNGTFVHNTIVNAQEHALRVVNDGLVDSRIQDNLIVNSGKAQLKNGAPFRNVAVGYNGWFDADADSAFTGPTDIVGSGNPGFADVANNDYRLTADSPVRDAGTDVGVTIDFEGDPRLWGGHPDIGADEYVPDLHLAAIPYDGAIHLSWTEFEHPDLASYAITYTYNPGGSDAAQGSLPILNIPPSERNYALTGLVNYVLYSVTIAARDGNQADLALSNSVRVMPADIFFCLPLIMKKAL